MSPEQQRLIIIEYIHSCYAHPCKEKTKLKYYRVIDQFGSIYCQAFCQTHLYHTKSDCYSYTETDYETWLKDAYPRFDWEQILVRIVMES